MIRMTTWLGLTAVGTALLATMGGVALPLAFLYSALASAVLANIDNMPRYGHRGMHYMRPMFTPGFFGGPHFSRPHYRRAPHFGNTGLGLGTPLPPPPSNMPVSSTFIPAHAPTSGSGAPVLTRFNPAPKQPSAPPSSRPAAASTSHRTPPPGVAPTSSRFVPAASNQDNGKNPVSTRFRPAGTHG